MTKDEVGDALEKIIDNAWDFDNNRWKLGGVGVAVREAYNLGLYVAREGGTDD